MVYSISIVRSECIHNATDVTSVWMSRIQNPELRIREFTFQPDALIKLTVRNFESGVTLKINDEGVSRFREPELRHSKVGVYGCSLHLDGTLVTEL